MFCITLESGSAKLYVNSEKETTEFGKYFEYNNDTKIYIEIDDNSGNDKVSIYRGEAELKKDGNKCNITNMRSSISLKIQTNYDIIVSENGIMKLSDNFNTFKIEQTT